MAKQVLQFWSTCEKNNTRVGARERERERERVRMYLREGRQNFEWQEIDRPKLLKRGELL